MAKYIEREAVNNICLKHYNESFDDIPAHEALYAVTDDINNIPSADVVEVVRCKDCKYNVANMTKEPLDATDYSGADIVCSYFMTDGLHPDGFCSYGERRSDNENT